MGKHADIVSWQLLEQKIGIRLKIIRVLDNGTLDFDQFETLLSEKTKLLALTYISNALGTINPIEKFIKTAKNYNSAIKVLIDGTQAAVHKSVDVQGIGCDFFTFTGHKLYGPNGIGVLWGKAEILADMPPYQGGGDMIETVSLKSGTTFKEAPARFEAGTPAIAEVIALGTAIDYVQQIGIDNIAAHEAALYQFLRQEIDAVDGLTIYADIAEKAAILSFNADWAHASDIAMILDQCGVAVRTGHHCCMPLMEAFGIDATVRASIGLYNNKDDIIALVEGLKKAKEMLA